MTFLFLFDHCGTLLPGSTGSLEIARALGCWPEVAALEGQLARGEIETPRFISLIHELWAGDATAELTPEVVARAVENAPWIRGAREVMADIRARGDHSLVVTMTPRVFAEHLVTLGVDRVIAQPVGPLPLRPGSLRPSQVLTSRHKPTLARAVHAELAVDEPDVGIVAFGDGASDLDLFAELPGIPRNRHDAHRVAVNASDPIIRDVADVQYDGPDLWEAYQLARARLRQPAATGVS